MVAAWNKMGAIIISTGLLLAAITYTFTLSPEEHWATFYLMDKPFVLMTDHRCK